MKIWLLFAIPVALSGQMAEGAVVDSVSGAPLAGAVVLLRGASLTAARTDALGHFRIAVDPEIKSPLLNIQRNGYLYGNRTLPSPSTPEFVNLKIALTPQAVITGRVDDEEGYPLSNASVQAFRFRTINGQSIPQAMSGGTTNDLGEYRLAGLPPGQWYLWVSHVDRWDVRYSPEYYGGTAAPQESNTLETKAGEVRSGIDFHFKRHEGVDLTVRWTAPAAWGKPQQVTVAVATDRPVFVRTGVPQPDGSFRLLHVRPGAYEVTVNGQFPSLPRPLSVEQPLELSDASRHELVVSFEAGAGVDVSGTVVSDGGLPVCLYAIGLQNAGIATASTKSRPDGAFTVPAVKAGHYALMLAPDDCRSLTVSARVGDRDVLKNGLDVGAAPVGPLQIQVTRKVATLTGKVVDAAGNSVAAFLLFEDETTGRRFTTSPNTSADFQPLTMLPGNYRVYAATSLQQRDQLMQAAYRKEHANDLPMVRVVEGENSPLIVKLR